MLDEGNMRRGKFRSLSGGPFLGRAGRDGVRGWLILEKKYTCTLYNLEGTLYYLEGKKGILHNSSVQKIHARSMG